MPEYYRACVHRSATLTTALTFILIVAGGLVTSRDAGLAVPDWPLSFGMLNPPRWYAIENVRTEHGHRLIAGLVGLATALTAWLVHRHEPRRWVRRFTAAALAIVMLQAVLGGLRVLELSVDLAMVHACLAQLFFTVIIVVAAATSPAWKSLVAAAAGSKRIRVHSSWACAAVFTQLLFGIAIRHGGAGAAAVPATTSLLQAPMFYVHLIGAALVAWLCLSMAAAVNPQGGGESSLKKPAEWLGYLVMLQIGLGLASLGVTDGMAFDRQATALESWLPTMHVATGAAILGVSCVIATVAWFASAGQPVTLSPEQASVLSST